MKFHKLDCIKWWNKTNKQASEQTKQNLCVRAWVFAVDLSPFLVLSWIALPIFMDLTSLLFLRACVCVGVCACVRIPRYSLNMRNWWTKNKQQQQALWADTFDIVIFMFSLKSKPTTSNQSWMVKSNLLHLLFLSPLSFVQIRKPNSNQMSSANVTLSFQLWMNKNDRRNAFNDSGSGTETEISSESIDRSINWTLIDIVFYFDLNEFSGNDISIRISFSRCFRCIYLVIVHMGEEHVICGTRGAVRTHHAKLYLHYDVYKPIIPFNLRWLSWIQQAHSEQKNETTSLAHTKILSKTIANN